MKQLILSLALCCSILCAYSNDKTQQLHFSEGPIIGNSTDTIYTRILSNETLIIDIGFKAIKGGGTLEIKSMEGELILKETKIKNKRIKQTLNEKNCVIQILIHNPTANTGQFKLKVTREIGNNNPSIIDPTVYWQNHVDTIYKWVDVQYVVQVDTLIEQLLNETHKVHSQLSAYQNELCIQFDLPKNTLKWSYYIGVDQQGKEAYESAVTSLSKAAGGAISPIKLNPLGILMSTGAEVIVAIQGGEDINFEVCDEVNKDKFLRGELNRAFIASGRMINGSRSFSNPNSGHYHICLENDNAVTGVEVNVIVSALVLKATYETRKEKQIAEIKYWRSWY